MKWIMCALLLAGCSIKSEPSRDELRDQIDAERRKEAELNQAVYQCLVHISHGDGSCPELEALIGG